MPGITARTKRHLYSGWTKIQPGLFAVEISPFPGIQLSNILPMWRFSKKRSLFVKTIIAAASVTQIVSTHFVVWVIAIFSCMKFTKR